MKTYKGIRTQSEKDGGSGRGICKVFVDEAVLQADKKFEWGYRGKMATALSEAILKDAFCENLITKQVIYRFKEDVVKRLAFNTWILTEDQIDNWLDQLLREQERMNKTHVGNR